MKSGEVWERSGTGRMHEKNPRYGAKERETGAHGPIFREFRHDAAGAIAKLMEVRTGEAPAALHPPAVGDIDLVWGEVKQGGGYGLAKIAERHPEVLEDLQGVLDRLAETRRTEQTVFLEDAKHTALVRLNWKGDEKKWLLTAYEKGTAPSAGGTIDVSDTHAAGRQAPPPGGVDSSVPPKRGELKRKPGERGSISLKPVQRSIVEEGSEYAARPNAFRAAIDFIRPVQSRLADLGAAGKTLAGKLTRARDVGEVQAGKRIVRLRDSGLMDLEQADRWNLLDVL